MEDLVRTDDTVYKSKTKQSVVKIKRFQGKTTWAS